jgi:predicted Zn-dependent protease
MASNNIFATGANVRSQEQKKLAATSTGQQIKRQERTLISVSLTLEDRDKLKRYAYEQGATVSGLVQKWIRENCK